MRIPRFYHNAAFSSEKDIKLSLVASQHLLRVLRARIGEKIIIFNGMGGEYFAELKAIEGKLAIVHLGEHRDVSRQSPLNIHLGQGLSRGERMDYVIQKAVELGVSEITPLLTERCNVKLNAERTEKRINHWRSVIISACEQSGLNIMPIIHPPLPLSKWVAQQEEGLKIVCDVQHDQRLSQQAIVSRTTLLIGPEGGLTKEEITLAHEHEFISMSLGPRVLRTETAAVVAVALLQSQWGDL